MDVARPSKGLTPPTKTRERRVVTSSNFDHPSVRYYPFSVLQALLISVTCDETSVLGAFALINCQLCENLASDQQLGYCFARHAAEGHQHL